MEQLGLNTQIEKTIDFKKVIHKMQTDKKSSNKSINLVLIKDYQLPYKESPNFPFYPTNSDLIFNFLNNYRASLPELFRKDLSKFLKK
jgi:3-dehydroquinate synthetase